MSDASIHFPEKRGGWNAHRLENSPENVTVMVAEKSKAWRKKKKKKNSGVRSYSFLFLINHLLCVSQTAVQNGF